MRALAVACAAFLAGACGGREAPTAPRFGPPQQPQPPSFQQGFYNLRFDAGSVADNGQAVACLTGRTGDAPVPSGSVSLVVVPAQADNGWVFRMVNATGAHSGDLVITLAPLTAQALQYPAGSVVAGTAGGTAYDEAGRTIKVASVSGDREAILAGAAEPNAAHGDVTGQIVVSASGSWVSCTPTRWSLTRR